MKILIDARMYGLENSGIGRYLINLTDELKVLDKNNEYIIFLKNKYFGQLNFPDNWTKIECDIKHYSVAEQIKLTGLIAKYKADVVHFPHFNVPITYSGKFVVTIHDMTMHRKDVNASNLPVYKYLIKRQPYKMVFNHAVKASKMIIVPSKFVKNELLKNFGIDENKVNVIYEGYREILYEKSGASEIDVLNKYNLLNKKYFFYVGNLFPHKNIEIVLSAIKHMDVTGENEFKFVIAGGNNAFTDRLRKYSKKIGIENITDFIGFVTDRELLFLYKHSQSFIFPSLSEGFGLPGLEAISAGSLLIASDIPIFREIYGDNAIYFNPLDIQDCFEAMLKVLKMDLKDKNERINKAKQFISKYSWRKMAEETLGVYENCNCI